MLQLRCNAQNYEWGRPASSSEVFKLAKAGGNSVDESKPFAEFWMGTHPNCPSVVAATGETLQAWIEAHPHSLGDTVLRRFGASLPFLFKVLSVNKALSIQSHPDKALAEKLRAEHPKLYPDDNHKPEMALALSDDFEALCSFAPLTHVAAALREVPELLELVGVEQAAGVARAARETSDEERSKQALRAAFTSLMMAPQDAVGRAVGALVTRLRGAGVTPSAPAASAPATRDPVSEVEHVQGAQALALRLDKQYPGGDVGVMAAFFLNTVHLKGGQAIYLPANEPHAYLAGELVECMAASDNVIRAGLTPKFKHADVLCASLTYTTGLPEVLAGSPAPPLNPSHPAAATLTTYRPPFEEFEVRLVRVAGGSAPVTLPADPGPAVVLVQAGQGTATATAQGVHTYVHLQQEAQLCRGSVFFLPAGMGLSLVAQGAEELVLWVAATNALLHQLHAAVGAGPATQQLVAAIA